MTFGTFPLFLLRLSTWYAHSGILIATYHGDFHEEITRGLFDPRSFTDSLASDEPGRSVPNHGLRDLSHYPEPAGILPAQSPSGQLLSNAVGEPEHFEHTLNTVSPSVPLQHGKRTRTGQFPEHQVGMQSLNRDTYNPSLLDLAPAHREIREFGDASIRAQHETPLRAQSGDEFLHPHSSNDWTPPDNFDHVFGQGLGVVEYSSGDDYAFNALLGHDVQYLLSDEPDVVEKRSASSEISQHSSHFLPGVPATVSSLTNPDPLWGFSTDNLTPGIGLRLNVPELQSLVNPEHTLSEPPRRMLSRYPSSQQLSISGEVVPNVQITVPVRIVNVPSPLLEMQLPRMPITNLISDSLKFVGHRCFPEYMSRVEEKLRYFVNLLGGLRPGGKEHHFEGIAAVHVTFDKTKPTKNADSVIQLVATPQSGDIRRIPRILMILRPLISWVLMDHAALLYTRQECRESEKKANEELVSWIIKELFTPEESLPVFGIVREELVSYERRNFGLFQQLIIDHFSSNGDADYVHQSARKLVYLWYKTEKNILDDQAFWKNMNQATELAFYEDEFWSFMNQRAGPITFHSVDKARSKSIAIEVKPGNLEVFQLKNILRYHFAEKKRLTTFWDVNSETIDESTEIKISKLIAAILQKKTMKSQETAVGSKIDQLTLPGIPIALASKKKDMGEKQKTYIVRMLAPNAIDQKKIVSPYISRRRLFSLLSIIKGYLSLLLHFSATKNHKNIPNPYISLFSWLNRQLFTPRNSKPIFGAFKEYPKNLNPGLFGEAQHLISRILTSPVVEADQNQWYTNLLGLWYKNDFEEIWNINFKHDFEYWILMAGGLGLCKVPLPRGYKDF